MQFDGTSATHRHFVTLCLRVLSVVVGIPWENKVGEVVVSVEKRMRHSTKFWVGSLHDQAGSSNATQAICSTKKPRTTGSGDHETAKYQESSSN
jgi:hypothetical protein